jgi:hypothetical protein
MHLVELSVAGNEASDLLRVEEKSLLAELTADCAYWTVLDEGPVEQCLALLVHTQDGWSARHVAARAGAYVLADVGPGPLGVRALCARDDGRFDVVVGSIDALDKGSVLLDAHPQTRDATCRHWRFSLPELHPAVIKPEAVADLAPLHHVEGIAEWQGRSLYVTDEDHRVALYVSP